REEEKKRKSRGVDPSGHYSLWDNTAVRAPPNDSGPRFWLAVHAVDSSPLARAVGVLGNRAIQHADRQARGERSGRNHSVWRAEERIGHWRTKMRTAVVRPGHAGARHLLRHAVDDRRARWRSAPLRPTGIRPCACARGPERQR